MPNISFTPHQQQAVDVRGGNLLISAAAGSGKTAVLTERAVQLLTEENAIPADRLVVVTFTVAAADEMRQRISSKLAERIAADPTNEWLQSQQLLLSSAKISTIHSLCNSLIKENAELLGIFGELRISDDANLAVLQAEALQEVLEEAYTAADPDFLHLVECTCVKNDKPLCKLIQDIYNFIRSFSFPLSYLDRAEKMYEQADSIADSEWGKSIREHLAAALSYCEETLQFCMEEMRSDAAVFPNYSPAFSSDLSQISRIHELINDGKMSEASEALLGMQKKTLDAVRKYPDPDFLDSLKARRQKVYDILKDIGKRYLNSTDDHFRQDIALLRPQIHALFELVRSVYARIEKKKNEQGIIDYSDLEHLALSLLVKPLPEGGWARSERAEELSANIDQIMIDECQDINEVQNLIFNLLSRNGTNLYMVGDVKQSIYRFRKAMPDLFIEKKKAFSPYCPETHTNESEAVITLETNFRSRKEVCDVVNYLFTRLMSSEVGEIDYTEKEALFPGACYPEYPDAAAEIHIVDYNRSAEDEKTAVEARYIASRIKRMIASGYQVSDGKGGMRQCRYRDFAILLRSYREKSRIYASELTAAGVPCFCETSERYFDSYEVMVVLNLLRTIDNPLKDVPLLSVLLSPMFRFSADQITKIRLAQRNVPFYRAMLICAEEGDEACLSFLDTLRFFRQTAATCSVDALIQEIYDRTDFLALTNVMSGGGDKEANLRLLITHAANYEQVGNRGLSGFLRYIDHVIQSDGDLSAANSFPANTDSVRMMSIHKSKGLEFPICIVADCGKAFNKMDLTAKSQMNGSLGFSMKITDPDTLRSYTSLPFEAIRLKTERETISEEMRVLYVAMTRAKEKLILVMTMPNAKDRLRSLADLYAGMANSKPLPYQVFRAQGYDEWLLSVFLFHPGFSDVRQKIGRMDLPIVASDVAVRGILASSDVPLAETPDPERRFYAEPSDELSKKLNHAIRFSYPQKPLTQVPAKLTVTQIAKQANAEQTPDGPVKLKFSPKFLQQYSSGVTPAQRGTILHSFMQFSDFAAAEADLEGEITRLVQEKFLTAEEVSVLNRSKIAAFLHSPLYARMKAALSPDTDGMLLREYKFLYYLKAGDIMALPPEFRQEEILIQGIADALLFEDGEITILDYKTDYVNDPQILVQRYYDQLRIYRDAIGKAFHLPVRQCLLYSLHLEREIEIPFPGKEDTA